MKNVQKEKQELENLYMVLKLLLLCRYLPKAWRAALG